MSFPSKDNLTENLKEIRWQQYLGKWEEEPPEKWILRG
jgi:hypothetical protein